MKYQGDLGSKSSTAESPSFNFPIPMDAIPVGSEILNAVVKAEGYAGLNRPKSNYKMQIVHNNSALYTSSAVALNRKYQLHTFKNLEQYFPIDGKNTVIRFNISGTYRYFEIRNVSITITYNPPEVASKAFAGTKPWKAIFIGTIKARGAFIGTKRIL